MNESLKHVRFSLSDAFAWVTVLSVILAAPASWGIDGIPVTFYGSLLFVTWRFRETGPLWVVLCGALLFAMFVSSIAMLAI